MNGTLMASEAASAPQLIAQQLQKNQSVCADLGAQIRAFDPTLVYIIGRGSSDHAGVYAKYLIEVELGIPVCAAAPSVTGLFGRQLNLKRALVLCISQSGRSPDILTQAAAARKSGALCVALVNDQSSPLAELADVVVPLLVGEEKAVAATKSYLATLSAILQLVAFWANNPSLQQALTVLPKQLHQAVDAPPQLTQSFVDPLKHCVVLGRSFGYAISREIALKLKEVLGIHAESFSSAEFLHGPVTLVANKLGVIDIDLEDESAIAHRAQIAEIAQRGGIMAQLHTVGTELHPRTAALTVLQRFYLDIEQIAVSMGRDPDRPVGLNKVTKTV